MINFLDIKEINLAIEDELKSAFDRVLKSGWFIHGKEVENFEAEFAAYCGTTGAVGVSNGLDALHLILRAYDIGPGDEVIVPANTFIATWLAVTYCGAIPVPVEPLINTYNIDPAKIEAAIKRQRPKRSSRCISTVNRLIWGRSSLSARSMDCVSSKMQHRRTEPRTKGLGLARWGMPRRSASILAKTSVH